MNARDYSFSVKHFAQSGDVSHSKEVIIPVEHADKFIPLIADWLKGAAKTAQLESEVERLKGGK